MGCDIHMVAQVRREGRWVTVDWPNPHFGRFSWETNERTLEAFGNRSYDTFAILADVRNGRDFAGCDTGDGFNSIAPQRGYPSDFEVCSDTHQGFYMGDHSHTWMTLEETLAFDWEQTTKKRGWINGVERMRMMDAGATAPSEWCGRVSGTSIRHVSLPELDRALREELFLVIAEPENSYALIEWEVTYRESAWDFTFNWLPKFEQLGQPEDVRLVMGFDS